MAEHKFNNQKRAFLHPKLENDGATKLVVMDVDLGENDRMEFKGVIDVEFGLSPSDALPNGTFYYDELPEPMVPTPVYASYFRDMDGTDRIRVEFKVGPGETTQLGCFESDEAIPSLAFISDSHGPGAFIRAPKE